MVLCCVWCCRPNGRTNMTRLHIWLGVGSFFVLAHAIMNCVLLGISKRQQHQRANGLEVALGFAFYTGVEAKLVYELRVIFAILAVLEFGVAGLMAFLSTVYFSRHRVLLISGFTGLVAVELGIFLTYLIGSVTRGGEPPLLRLIAVLLLVLGFAGVPFFLAIRMADTEEVDEHGDRRTVVVEEDISVVEDEDVVAEEDVVEDERGSRSGRSSSSYLLCLFPCKCCRRCCRRKERSSRYADEDEDVEAGVSRGRKRRQKREHSDSSAYYSEEDKEDARLLHREQYAGRHKGKAGAGASPHVVVTFRSTESVKFKSMDSSNEQALVTKDFRDFRHGASGKEELEAQERAQKEYQGLPAVPKMTWSLPIRDPTLYNGLPSDDKEMIEKLGADAEEYYDDEMYEHEVDPQTILLSAIPDGLGSRLGDPSHPQIPAVVNPSRSPKMPGNEGGGRGRAAAKKQKKAR